MKDSYQKGMTLIELTVVLLILIGLAGLTIPYVGGVGSKALCDATDVSMANIKRVIMDRYYLDTLGNFPKSKADTDYSLHYLFDKYDWGDFDVDSQVGWRGPYLQGAITIDSNTLSQLDNSFKDASLSPNYVNKDLDVDDFAVLDAWGRPIIIQVTDDCSNWDISSVSGSCARLVSAGFSGEIGLNYDPNLDPKPKIDTPVNGHKGGNSINEDRILYLNAPTPAEDINTSCGT